MGTIALVNTLIYFSIITFCYSIFSYSLAIIKICVNFFKKREKSQGLLLFGSVSLFFLSIPLVLAMVLTVLYKNKPVYLFFWVIYAYATYGTIKITTAIIGLNKARKMKDKFKNVDSYFSLISALYTIQMMEFALIATFGEGEDLFMLQMLTQGVIFVVCILLSVKLFVGYIKNKKIKQGYANSK